MYKVGAAAAPLELRPYCRGSEHKDHGDPSRWWAVRGGPEHGAEGECLQVPKETGGGAI